MASALQRRRIERVQRRKGAMLEWRTPILMMLISLISVLDQLSVPNWNW
jgi:hypothetical protein